MEYKFDLMNFVGEIEITGGGPVLNGMTRDRAEIIRTGKHFARDLLRYLFSDKPFTVKGGTYPKATWTALQTS